jgi:polar amino acid transport system substrate-binding protein
MAQRIDGVVLQEVTADYYLRTDPKTYQAITKVSPPIKTKAYYLMLSHAFVDQHPDIAETIWDTLKMLRETEFDTIAAKYLK